MFPVSLCNPKTDLMLSQALSCNRYPETMYWLLCNSLGRLLKDVYNLRRLPRSLRERLSPGLFRLLLGVFRLTPYAACCWCWCAAVLVSVLQEDTADGARSGSICDAFGQPTRACDLWAHQSLPRTQRRQVVYPKFAAVVSELESMLSWSWSWRLEL